MALRTCPIRLGGASPDDVGRAVFARAQPGGSVARIRGFSLAESLIASTVLAVAVVAVALTTGTAFQQDQALADAATAVSLGRELMEQIASKSFSEIGSFNNYTDNTVARRMSPTAAIAAGTTAAAGGPGSAIYRRNVTVTYRASLDGSPTSNGDYATVQVTVETPSGRKFEMSRLFTRLDLQLPEE
jgi:prepilin-type N-terminal cleavage/methylation domain-containing protein